MSPHPPPFSFSPNPSPSPSSRTCSSPSTSTDPTQSYTYRFKPRDTSPAPNYEMGQITLRQRETALFKASKELEREKAAFLMEKADFQLEKAHTQREKDELQRQKNEFAAANDKTTLAAKQKKDAVLERQRKELWEGATIVTAIFLCIPALALSATLLAAETVGGWRMFIWAIVAAAGNGGQGR